MKTRRRVEWGNYLFILPIFLLFGIFIIYPIVYNFIISFHEWSGVGNEKVFVGFQNYVNLFNGTVIWKILRNFVVFALVTVIVQAVLGMIFASFFINRLKGSGIFRVLFYLPAVVTSTIIGQVFSKPVMELISSHRKAAADYLEYRREIEGVAAEYAARRATPDDLALLDRIMARMDEAHRTGDFQHEADIDVEFHNAVGECAHNINLLHTLRSCYRLLSEGVFQNRLLVFTLPGARDELLAQHRAIHAAVKSGNPAAARKAAMDHITYVERSMVEAERSGDWQRVSRLRLKQRGGDVKQRDGESGRRRNETDAAARETGKAE